VKPLIETEGKARLRARLKEEAIATADRDLAMAAEPTKSWSLPGPKPV
jgi:hypothetical protein